MTNNSTKKALLMSCISLLLCLSMLVGTTFAWFTDTATTGVNTIVAGNLDIALYQGVVDGDTITYDDEVTSTTKLFEDTLWEPGHTQVAYLKVENRGSLALTYRLAVEAANEVPGTNVAGQLFYLSDYIEFGVIRSLTEIDPYANRGAAQAAVDGKTTKLQTYMNEADLLPGESFYIALVVYMPTTVGNEANYKTGTTAPSIDLGVSLFATQADHESDSYGPDYDAGAFDYNGPLDDYVETVPDATDPEKITKIIIHNAAGLMAYAEKFGTAETKDITTVEIAADIDLAGYEWKPMSVWDPENGSVLTIDGQGHTISNMTVNGGDNVGFFGLTARNITVKDLAFENASVITSGSRAGVVFGGQYSNVILDNVDVTNSIVRTTAEKGIRIGGLIGQSFLHEGATLTLTNCDLDGISVSGYHNVAGMVGSLMNYSTLLDKWEMKNNSITNSVFTITSDSMNNHSYVSAFAVEGGNWGDANKYTWADVNTFARADYQGPNTADHNTYNIPEQTDPNAIIINTVADLKAFRDAVNAGDNYLNKNVYLAADLDLNNEEWTPIGTAAHPFQGNFSGRGHTISNLKITSGENVGLFGHITLSPSNYTPGITNLTLNNVTISADNSGAFVGNANTTTNNAGNGGALQLTHLTLTGEVKIEGANVGSIMGTNWTNFQIHASAITVIVRKGSYVKGTGVVGGVFAATQHGSVSNITSNMDVIASGEAVVAGGIVGCAGWTLTDVTCTGDVIVTDVAATADGKYQVGKIVGCEANNSYWSLYKAPVEGNTSRGLGSEFENFTATGEISITLSDSTVLTANGLTAADHRGTDNLIDYTQSLVGAAHWTWAW